MIRKVLAGAAVAVGLAIGSVAGDARAAAERGVPDLTGYWRLDPARSAAPVPGMESGARAPRDGARGPREGMEGRRGGFGGERGMRGGPPGGGAPDAGPVAGRRPMRLPDFLHVTQMDDLVSFEDSTGAVIEEITTIGSAKDTLAHAPGATVLAGGWKDGKLSAEREGPRGGKVTQSFWLEDGGKSLMQVTHIEGPADMPVREFRRAWLRAAQ